MALFDDIYRTDYEQFFRYMKGENLEDPNSISLWRKYQNFASRRPNRKIKALEKDIMYPKCMKRGYEIYHVDAFYPKDKRRFKEKSELDYFCRKEILDTCKKVFAKEYNVFLTCIDAAEEKQPGEGYLDFFRLQMLKHECLKDYERSSKYMLIRLRNVYKPNFPENPFIEEKGN